MSFAGGVLILAVIALRALALNRLPKGTFLALWAMAVLRLLAPFSIPSPASVYTLMERMPVQTAVSAVNANAPSPAASAPVLPAADFASGAAMVSPAAASAPESGTPVNVLFWVWLAGMAVCGTYFLVSYLRCRREFRAALPLEEGAVMGLRPTTGRPVSLRVTDRVDAPLTYGLLRPVILLPKGWAEDPRLAYALDHELTHIRHLDALWKLALAFTACVHWFNPLVWCMFALANRDLELRCDEAVVRRLGVDSRSQYAQALISLEEKRSGLGPFASAFNKNAIEERIIAIMKIKRRSLAAVLAAVALVCCVGAAFATSAAKTEAPYPKAPDGTFARAELDRLSELWFEGYQDMTIADYQQKMWTEFDTRSDIELIDRYGQNSTGGGLFGSPEVILPEQAFSNYFFYVFKPLTAERWQSWTFAGADFARIDDTHIARAEYACTLRVLDAETLTVGEYEQVFAGVKAGVRAMLYADPAETDLDALSRRLTTEKLAVTVEGRMTWVDNLGNIVGESEGRGYTGMGDPDAELYAQSSRETAAEWDRLLSPYVPFGLTYRFDDPGLDGNGLTMWWGGKEVRGIYDEQEHTWLTEHTGIGFSEGAVELYAVYTDGVLSGLREADPDDQAAFDEIRQRNRAAIDAPSTVDAREFPRATREDYDAFLALRQRANTSLPSRASYPYRDYQDEPLESFNQRLLDWANEDADGVWDRISCDVIWNDYGVELTADERSFVSLTCLLSGRENAAMIRAIHTGGPEEDPGFSANLPERSIEENGIVNAWCDLYYSLSYHIADKSAVSVAERDACVSGMMSAIDNFWLNTDFETLLGMAEADVAARFNVFAEENSTENVKINPVTEDDLYFEPYDERGIDTFS